MVTGGGYYQQKEVKREKNKMKIIHWTIKYTWEDGTEEYVDDIPNYIAKNVDEFLNNLEILKNSEK